MIAAGLLLHLEEEQAYWMLCAAIENILPLDYYTPGMQGIMVDQQVFALFLAERLPELHAHFTAVGFDTALVTTSWFVTLFVETCPLEVSVSVAIRTRDWVKADRATWVFGCAVVHRRYSASGTFSSARAAVRCSQRRWPSSAQRHPS